MGCFMVVMGLQQLVDLEIYEVTTAISLSTGMSCTTKSIASINVRINQEKYKHTCQVKNLNLGE